MKKHIYSALILGSIFLVSCSSDEKNTAELNEKPIAVTVNKSATNSAGSNATASGKLVAKNSVNVSTRMMGYITGMRAEVGQYVNAGQLLVSINNTDIQAKGGQASANIAQAQANYNIAKKDFERFQNLYKNQSASQKDLEYQQAIFEYNVALEYYKFLKN